MNEKKEKGKGILVTIIMVLLIVCCGLGIFIFMNKDKLFTKQEQTKDNSSSDYVYIYDVNKIKDKGNTMYSRTGEEGLDGVSYTINEDNPKEVNVDVNWNLIFNNGLYGEIWENENKAKKDKNENFKIEFDNEVIDIYRATFGLDITNSKMIFLMKDGSLQYLDDYEATENSDFSKVKKMNIKKVVKFYTVSAKEKDSHFSANYTTLAQTTDGSIYDLRYLME